MQSPIKFLPKTTLRLAEPKKLLEIQYKAGDSFDVDFDHDHPAHGNFILLGPTFPTILFRGGNFRLSAVHIHKSPEHAIDLQVPEPTFEIHFIHIPQCISNDQAKLVDCPKVVVGVLYHYAASTSDQTQGGLKAFGRELSKRLDSNTQAAMPLIPSHFFPLDGSNIDLANWYHYEGSLTSFPFSENVSWFVMKSVASVAEVDTKPFELHAEQEAREFQPLERRLVVRSFKLPDE